MSDVAKFFEDIIGNSARERESAERKATRMKRILDWFTKDDWHVHKWRICRDESGWIICDSMLIDNLWKCEDCGEEKWAHSIAHSDSFPVLVKRC